jgi:hypothetical protein
MGGELLGGWVFCRDSREGRRRGGEEIYPPATRQPIARLCHRVETPGFSPGSFHYHWKDRPNKRDYCVTVTEDGRLLEFACCDAYGMVLQKLDFSKFDFWQNLWYLPTSDHPFILNQNNNTYYELGVPKLDESYNQENKPDAERILDGGKIVWYEFSDERNQRIYEVGFHMDGDLMGYRSYGKTKDDILLERPSIEDTSFYQYEHLKVVGKFVLVTDPEEESPIVSPDIVPGDEDIPSKG